jgi:hypothetical protein
MRIIVACLSLGLSFLSPSLLAQPPDTGTPMRVRGTIQAFDGQTMTVSTVNDGAVAFAIPPNIGINGVVRRSSADIVDGRFIGTTAAVGADGRWRATEVHMFPEEMRGAGEGHYPWDFPETTMTNGTVTGTVTGGGSRALAVTHAGGEVEVVVDAATDIVELVAGDASLFVPGATVFVLGTLQADGTFNAFAIVAEKEGVKPPM